MSGGVESRHTVYRGQPLEGQAKTLWAFVSPKRIVSGLQRGPHCQARADECWTAGVAPGPLFKLIKQKDG